MVPSYDQQTKKVNDLKSNDYLHVSVTCYFLIYLHFSAAPKPRVGKLRVGSARAFGGPGGIFGGPGGGGFRGNGSSGEAIARFI